MALGKIGKYERLDVLGHGTSGIVYLAWDSLLRRHVALKEITVNAEEEARFLEEARVLDRLRHPNIVQVNGVDRIDGHMLIDMEYVKGTNLNEYLRQHKRLPLREALSIAVQICDALEFAHRHHTVHRDVKPANILISDEGAAKIVDFGLAEILGSGSYAGGAGTYAYMAPEDFDEEQHSDHRSDIWAIGITLYEMLAGRRPFQSPKAKDPFSWKRTVEEEEPVPLTEIDPSIPSEVEEVVGRALEKDKRDRYQSAGEMYGELTKILMAMGGPVHLAGTSQTFAQMVTPIPESAAAESNSEPDIEIWPDGLSFGKLRKGESNRQTLEIRVPGRGKIEGRVASQPGWISVEPLSFDRRKQRLNVIAHMDSIWRPGVYNEELDLEIEGRHVSVPLHALVLPPRRSFWEVAWWYIPLLLFTLLPLATFSGVRSSAGAQNASLIATGCLSAMLFIVAMVADLGSIEKLLPTLFGAICLGAVSGVLKRALSHGGAMPVQEGFYVLVLGSMLPLEVALQLLSASKWRFWSIVLILTSIAVTAVLMR